MMTEATFRAGDLVVDRWGKVAIIVGSARGRASDTNVVFLYDDIEGDFRVSVSLRNNLKIISSLTGAIG